MIGDPESVEFPGFSLEPSIDSSLFFPFLSSYLYFLMMTLAVELLILSFLAALLMLSLFSITSMMRCLLCLITESIHPLGLDCSFSERDSHHILKVRNC